MHAEGCYLIFDCPGQVELFTLHDALLKILKVMTDDWHLRWGPLLYSCRNRNGKERSKFLPPKSDPQSQAERNDFGLNLPVCRLLLPLCCLPGWRRCT